MATKQQISKMVVENFGSESKRQFIENEHGCSFEHYVEVFSTEAAKDRYDIESAYEAVYSENRYFSPNPNFCKQ